MKPPASLLQVKANLRESRIMHAWRVRSCVLALMAVVLGCTRLLAVEGSGVDVGPQSIRSALTRAIGLLEKASAGTADQRTCFTCHGQALPVIALVEARQAGIAIDENNLNVQVEHTHKHLRRGLKEYIAGKGQGGGVDTAGYALWTLEDGGLAASEETDAVVNFLLKKQSERGAWRHSSDRPPSEASSFTTTYLALRALAAFGRDADSDEIALATERAEKWLNRAKPRDTEDSVFQLLSANYIELSPEIHETLIKQLKGQQLADGGWAQKDDMQSDAYATATVLYALQRAGENNHTETWTKGIRFLLSTQLDDGSWHVKTRSKPFQTYFETGFPHGEDQFISTSATAWASVVLAFALDGLPAPEQAQKTNAPGK